MKEFLYLLFISELNLHCFIFVDKMVLEELEIATECSLSGKCSNNNLSWIYLCFNCIKQALPFISFIRKHSSSLSALVNDYNIYDYNINANFTQPHFFCLWIMKNKCNLSHFSVNSLITWLWKMYLILLYAAAL